MKHIEPSGVGLKLRGEITPSTRIPLFVTVWLMGMTALGSLAWANLRYEIKSFSQIAVTEKQSQEWIDNARDKNPSITWPRLPQKTVEEKQNEVLAIAKP